MDYHFTLHLEGRARAMFGEPSLRLRVRPALHMALVDATVDSCSFDPPPPPSLLHLPPSFHCLIFLPFLLCSYYSSSFLPSSTSFSLPPPFPYFLFFSFSAFSSSSSSYFFDFYLIFYLNLFLSSPFLSPAPSFSSFTPFSSLLLLFLLLIFILLRQRLCICIMQDLPF